MKIEIQDADKNIENRTIWKGLDLFFEPGGIHAITGVSGSGKSTLLNCIGLVDRCSSGSILYGGVDLNSAPERVRRRYRRNNIGYLFQDYALVDYESVRSNIEFTMTGDRSRKDRAIAIDEALSHVGLSDKVNSKVYELSGGQKQRVALARLLVRDVDVVLADEPTGALDRANAEMVMQLLKDMTKNDVCIIIASHDQWVIGQADTLFSLDEHVEYV